MKPSSNTPNQQDRLLRSFVVAVFLVAIGAAAGFCQVPTIQGEVHHDETIDATIVSSPFVEPKADNEIFVDDQELKWSSASFASVLEQPELESDSYDTNFSQSGNGGWFSFLSEAKKKAQATNRPMMLLFTGSDWCPTCRRLDFEILKTSTFADWSRQRVIKVEVNFPRGYQLPTDIANQNDKLKNQYANYLNTGYPVALFIDADGNVLTKNRYTPEGVDAWIRNAERGLQSAKVSQADDQIFGQSILN